MPDRSCDYPPTALFDPAWFGAGNSFGGKQTTGTGVDKQVSISTCGYKFKSRSSVPFDFKWFHMRTSGDETPPTQIVETKTWAAGAQTESPVVTHGPGPDDSDGNYYIMIPKVSLYCYGPVITKYPGCDFAFGVEAVRDPTLKDSIAPAFVIFYSNVAQRPNQALGNGLRNGPDFIVQDFDVYLDLLPHELPAPVWSKKPGGPDSGNLTGATSTTATYHNPKIGGLYQFDVTVGGVTTRTNLLLPLAGADITGWLRTEVAGMKAYADKTKKAIVRKYLFTEGAWRTANKVDEYFIEISGASFDYLMDPSDRDKKSPTRSYQTPDIHQYLPHMYGYVTINGVVVHGSKINNMLWALFGRWWGYPTLLLKGGAHYNQWRRHFQLDGATSQQAIEYGGSIYDNPSSEITTILTPKNLSLLQVPEDLDEELLWPSPYPADITPDTLAQPILPKP